MRRGRQGTGEESAELGSREDGESDGRPGCRELTGQAEEPPSTSRSGGSRHCHKQNYTSKVRHLETGVRTLGRKQDWWYGNNINQGKGGKYLEEMEAGEVKRREGIQRVSREGRDRPVRTLGIKGESRALPGDWERGAV